MQRHKRWQMIGILTALTITNFLGDIIEQTTIADQRSTTMITDSDDKQHAHTNRLSKESSPYLLQHAHNPVDWYAWGEEAFEAARQQQKPIFLSMGYSTCYWCHVMERESFEDETTAAIMNEHYICIKVDREERPDVDDVYMQAVHIANNGRGGWPASIFLLPPPPIEKETAPGQNWVGLQPFWAGTYLPPEPAMGRPSFKQVLQGINQAWVDQRTDVIAAAKQLADAIQQRYSETREPAVVGKRQIDETLTILTKMFDGTNGGFGTAPKFPQPVFVEFLMQVRDSVTDPNQQRHVDAMLSLSLDRMAMGGIFDQVGGGFHRYSTDEHWLVPHFEKMLYDNGQLAALYAKAYQLTKDPYYAHITNRVCDYILKEMTDKEHGGFYAAQDAEVNHREGQNYLWTIDQIRAAILNDTNGDDKLADFAIEELGFNEGTNFQDPHHPDEKPSNVVFLKNHPDKIAKQYEITQQEVLNRLDTIGDILYKVREQRDQPNRDETIITGWNGLMIRGMAEAGIALGRQDLIEEAKRAWQYINTNLREPDGKRHLKRSANAGTIKPHRAFCEDYAYIIAGLISLHRATDDPQILADAINLTKQANILFLDEDGGIYYDTAADATDLFVRTRSFYDGAVPAPAGVMFHNLIDLYQITDEQVFLDNAFISLHAISREVHDNPVATINSTRGLQRLLETVPDRVALLAKQIAGDTNIDNKSESKQNHQPDPVILTTSIDTIRLDADHPATFALVFDIEKGYHINAHDPGDSNLIGLHVYSAGSGGIEVDAQYPDGETFTLGDQPINVYSGHLEIPIIIREIGAISGEPKIVVTFQVCTETECLQPIHHPLMLNWEFPEG